MQTRVHVPVGQSRQNNQSSQSPAQLLVEQPQATFRDARPETAQLKAMQAIMNSSPRNQNKLLLQGKFESKPSVSHAEQPISSPDGKTPTVQLRKMGKMGLEAEVMGERFEMMSLKEFDEARILADPEVVLEEYALGSIAGGVDVTLDNEVSYVDEISHRRSFTVEFVQDAVDVMDDDPSELEQRAAGWYRAGEFWRTNLAEGHKAYGMAGRAVDWFTENRHWEGDQFNNYKHNRNVSEKEGKQRLFWDGPGFFSYINAKNPDPDVSMQMTLGSTLEALETANYATSSVLRGGKMATPEAIARHKKVVEEDAELWEQNAEAKALVNILKRYYLSSMSAVSESVSGKQKRYNKEYQSMMVRNSLDAVFMGMSEAAKKAFCSWMVEYVRDKSGPLMDAFVVEHTSKFFSAETSKEQHSEAITIDDVLQSIVSPWEKQDEPEGDIFAQKNIAGISEINNKNQGALDKYQLNHAGEMMRGVQGLIFENRAAKTRKLSAMPEILRSLANVIKETNK
jgi:hypothetical protein